MKVNRIDMLVNITEEQLMKLLSTYFDLEVESCPLNAQAFCNVFFHKYGCKADLQWQET